MEHLTLLGAPARATLGPIVTSPPDACRGTGLSALTDRRMHQSCDDGSTVATDTAQAEDAVAAGGLEDFTGAQHVAGA